MGLEKNEGVTGAVTKVTGTVKLSALPMIHYL
jgi:hypothetical protein